MFVCLMYKINCFYNQLPSILSIHAGLFSEDRCQVHIFCNRVIVQKIIHQKKLELSIIYKDFLFYERIL